MDARDQGFTYTSFFQNGKRSHPWLRKFFARIDFDSARMLGQGYEGPKRLRRRNFGASETGNQDEQGRKLSDAHLYCYCSISRKHARLFYPGLQE